jgi:hypothetical protein
MNKRPQSSGGERARKGNDGNDQKSGAIHSVKLESKLPARNLGARFANLSWWLDEKSGKTLK